MEKNKIDVLTEKEFRNLFLQYKNGDLQAKEEIIIHNINLVQHVINKKIDISSNDKDDLFQTGIIGLIKAIDHFDMTKEIQFSTYATKCILNEILMYLRAQKKYQKELSINFVLNSDEEGNEFTLQDTLSTDQDFVEEMIDTLEKKEVLDILHSLTEKEIFLLKAHFGIGCERMSQLEIANYLGVSQSYASRCIKIIIKKIQFYLKYSCVNFSPTRTKKSQEI